ncbi:TPA: hypothetical protein ACPHT2_004306 [Vibrio antiquarius]
MDWFNENYLALYGAIVGTIALFLNFGRFWMLYQKSVRKLKVSAKVGVDAQRHINEAQKADKYSGDLCGPVYKVTVVNPSHTSIHIQDVGLYIDVEGKIERLKCYVRSNTQNFLEHMDNTSGEDLAAGSRRSYSVWISKEQAKYKLPKVIGSYVVDQMGKEYKGKFDATTNIAIPSSTEVAKPDFA